jgi:hypothetical protein
MPVFLPMGAVVCRYPQKFGGAGAGAGNGFLENLASLHQMTRHDKPVRMICNMTYLHDFVCMIACLHATSTSEVIDLA